MVRFQLLKDRGGPMSAPIRRYKEFNLTQLRVFCEFLRHKSFADAARTLGVSHSAVWQQVRALERRFGVSLLQRHGRAWQPTEDGQALIDLIANLLRSADSLDDAFRRLRGELPREVRVIASPSALAGELADPVAEIRRRHPATRVCMLLTSNLEQTIAELLTGTADLALLNACLLGSARRPSLQAIPVRRRPVGALVPARHPLTRQPRLTLTNLAAWPLILPTPDFPWRQQCDEVFHAAGLSDSLQVNVELSLIQAIEELVRRGVGVGVAPFLDGWKPGNGVRCLPAGHLFPPDELVLLRRRGKPRAQAQLLEDLLLDSSR
jgi:DNA-binding transcriptional LysR family regulator